MYRKMKSSGDGTGKQFLVTGEAENHQEDVVTGEAKNHQKYVDILSWIQYAILRINEFFILVLNFGFISVLCLVWK